MRSSRYRVILASLWSGGLLLPVTTQDTLIMIWRGQNPNDIPHNTYLQISNKSFYNLARMGSSEDNSDCCQNTVLVKFIFLPRNFRTSPGDSIFKWVLDIFGRAFFWKKKIAEKRAIVGQWTNTRDPILSARQNNLCNRPQKASSNYCSFLWKITTSEA